MTGTVQDILALIKQANAGSEAQTQASGQAAMSHHTGEKSQQEAVGGADISVNTAQKIGEGSSDQREALKDKIMRAGGKDKKDKEEGDVEAQTNYVQDVDAARTKTIDAGQDPLPPPGAVMKPVMKTASEFLTALHDQLEKNSSEKVASEEVVKIAADAEAWGRWAARGFVSELSDIMSEE